MEFKELVKGRRSIRSFEDRQVPDELLLELLDMARHAPSAGNCQPWHFYLIKNKETLSQLHKRAYDRDWFAKAPVAIVVCADIPEVEKRYMERGRDLYCYQDTAAAVQNILLGAKDLGLGTCWVGAFDEEACSDLLSLDKDMRPVAIIPLGYPAGEPAAPKRKAIEDVATFIV
ncbi:MAG TPA: nitroreductase family protein [Bacillota bacterium]|nr:nitroreductase family protein [Bacillota bacterium]